MNHRMSSVVFPHSNCRAEVGVKTVKRMIVGNTGANGSIHTDEFAAAMLQYRNTPDPETKMSLASVLFGRQIRDIIPILPDKYLPHPNWLETLSDREEALRNRHMNTTEQWSEHTRRLPPLPVCKHVRIQNQMEPHPRRWDKASQVGKVHQHDQYVIQVNGFRRVMLRNCQLLRCFTPAMGKRPKPRLLADDLLGRRPSLPPAGGNHRQLYHY